MAARVSRRVGTLKARPAIRTPHLMNPAALTSETQTNIVTVHSSIPYPVQGKFPQDMFINLIEVGTVP